MKQFGEVLISNKRNEIIPLEYDYFGALIGSWNFKWHDNIGTQYESVYDGKWTFARVLEGRAVQDTFVTSKTNPKTGALEHEYGTTIRIYNPSKKNWDVFYGCTGEAVLLVAEKVDEQIVLTCVAPVGFMMKWIFYDIEENSFKWKNIQSVDNGRTWVTKARAEDVTRDLT